MNEFRFDHSVMFRFFLLLLSCLPFTLTESPDDHGHDHIGEEDDEDASPDDLIDDFQEGLVILGGGTQVTVFFQCVFENNSKYMAIS